MNLESLNLREHKIPVAYYTLASLRYERLLNTTKRPVNNSQLMNRDAWVQCQPQFSHNS